jgi:hypothetical protein
MTGIKLAISDRKLAYNGAAAAVAAVFAYSLLVMLYVLVRSSVTIYTIMPKAGRMEIIWASGISAAYSVAVFSLIVAVPSAIAGALAALVLKRVLIFFNAGCNVKKAVLVSSVVAILLLFLLYQLLYFLLKERMTFAYADTFLFWFLFPGMIFLSVCAAGGSKLNTMMSKSVLALKTCKEPAAKTNTPVQ